DQGHRTGKYVAGGVEAAVRQRTAGERARAQSASDSGVPKGHEGRPRHRRPVWRRRPVERWDCGWLLQDDGGVVRTAGGRSAVRLRDALHEREGARAAGQREGFRGRGWPERRPGGRGYGEDRYDHHAEGRYLRLSLRTEGIDGGPRHTRQQD